MSFETYIPCDTLKPYVRSLAISESEKAETYKVLPGTGLVMGFQFSGLLAYTEAGARKSLSKAGITGLLNSYRLFSNSAGIGSLLVMFSETGAASFFDAPMHELFGQSLSLDDLVLRSQMDVVVEELCEAKTNLKRIAVVEDFLLSRLNTKLYDEIVALAVSLIRQHNGTIKIAGLAETLNISQSQFEKRFRRIVGASPKKFASIVRLNHLTQAKPGKNGLIGLGLDAGYFDQAHFIKDFKSFTGSTPEQFFGGK